MGGLGAGVLLLAALGASAAEAEEAHPRVQLRWQAPLECPDDLALVTSIEGFLGQPVAKTREQQLAIEAHVVGDESHGYAGKVTVVSAAGKNELSMEHQDCAKLTEAVALLMALAIDPDRVRALQQAPTSNEPVDDEPEAVPSPPPVLVKATPEPPPARRERPIVAESSNSGSKLHFNLGLLGLAAQGILPSVTPGLGLELALRLGGFEAALTGRAWAPRTASVPGAPGVGVELSVMTGGLRVCAVPARGKWSLLACARGDLGEMTGDGQQVDNSRPGHDRFAGLGGSLGVAYAVGRFSPRVGADLMWTVARPRFGVLQEGQAIQAFTPKPWHLAGFLGLAYEL